MNEIGLDPGIDHMSAMKVIDIKEKGGEMILLSRFVISCSRSDTNLWNYKFTWAPRNVVLAGQGGAAKFIQERINTFRTVIYFRTEFLQVEGYGRFEAYSNRIRSNSSVYGLNNVLTLYRGTIRRVGFSKAWTMFVQLGMTDDSYIMENSENMSYRDFVNSFCPITHRFCRNQNPFNLKN
jgi:saccharopine dehydrogenase-like NADP-dependent oxidoreductase